MGKRQGHSSATYRSADDAPGSSPATKREPWKPQTTAEVLPEAVYVPGSAAGAVRHQPAEWMIRPVVIRRKCSQSRRGEKTAVTPAMLRGIRRTLKLRSHNPLKVLPDGLRTYLSAGTLHSPRREPWVQMR